jgi:carbon-monoxide dehydrogenase medium subunit
MEFFAPKTLSETLSLIAELKMKGRLIAGGTNLIPDLRARVVKPQALIDISHLKSLSYIKEEKKRIRVGGLTTIADVASSAMIQKFAPILYEAALRLGNPLVRNRATIAGNLVDASPAADTAVPLLVLAALILTEKEGEKRREIPIDQFFVGPGQTILKPGEVVKEIIFPKPNPNYKMAYHKLGLRNSDAISVVSIAVLLEFNEAHCRKVRIGMGAVAPRPIRAYRAEEAMTGKKLTEELIEEGCRIVQQEIHPISDIRASAEYRRSMTSVLLKRVLQRAPFKEKDEKKEDL